jgi:hypothetical protein
MTDKPNQHGGRRAGAGRPSGRPNKEAAKVGGSKQRGESLSELAHRMQFFYQLHQEEGAKGAAADPYLLQASLDRAGNAAAALLPSCYSKLRRRKP